MPKPSLDSLPRNLRDDLTTLAKELADATSEGFRAFLVYGSAVRGQFREAKSDVNTILVLERVSLEVLDAVREPLALARIQHRVEDVFGIDALPANVYQGVSELPAQLDAVQIAHARAIKPASTTRSS